MSIELHFLGSSSTSKLVWLIIGFIFTSTILVQYYFQLPCGNGNHPFSSYCLIFLSTNKSSSRNYVSGRVPPPAMNIGKLGKDIDFGKFNGFLTEEHGGSSSSSSNSSSVREGKIVSSIFGSVNNRSRRRRQPSSGYLAAPPPYAQDSSPRINMMNKNNFTQISPGKGPVTPNKITPAECNLDGGLIPGKSTSETVTAGSNFNIPAAMKGDSAAVVSIATMNNILLQSYASPVPNSTCISGIDQELLDARLQIEKAPVFASSSEGLYAPIYWNISRFKRSYELMEKTLKVYVYREGNRPVFHQPNLKGIYDSEGWFMKHMEASKQYVTTNPTRAHLFYFPFSSQMLEQTVYVPNSHSFDRLKQYLANYLDIIKTKYPFWNRTSGADHFLVACHDWAPEETRRLMANCIRALCNADIKEGFQLGKDVSLPETLMPSAKEVLLRGYKKPPSQKKFLAFFAGKMHGYLRPILLKNWDNKKDPEMKIFGRMHKTNYVDHMKNSKYCICARGYEVNSPRLVESIMYGCVPVIISDNFVPPFLEVLNWEKIAVLVPERDIPNLKNILLSISERRYRVMQHRVKMVRRHFLWHPTLPEKYDIFHMILHSVWYNRVFRITQH